VIKASAKSSGWPSITDLEDLAESEVRDIAGQIFRAAVKFSPVYSGAFRASWRVSFNAPRLDTTAGRSPAAPIRGASFRWPTGFKLGDDVIISNNLPYAILIEEGSSKQAPFGVLKLAVQSVTFK
jgi:hypothetical protein